MKFKNKSLNTVIKEALSVDTGGSITSYLPTPLAMEVISNIRELNIMRKLIPTFRMAARTWTKPKRGNHASAYYIPDGVTATLTGMSATSVQWVAKKLMAYVMVDEEAIEDSQIDVIAQVMEEFVQSIAEAEEYAILSGDTTHLATAPTPTAATVANWYIRDSRLMFDGIFTKAASADAATPVAAGGAAIDPDHINVALYNLGKYGRNRANIIGLAPSDQAANLRMDANFKNASTSGQALASFITGLGVAGEKNAIVSIVYGIPIYEVPLAPAGHLVLMHKGSPEIGDRRLIKIKNAEIVESDQRKYVISERIAFSYNWVDAIVLVDNLLSTVSP